MALQPRRVKPSVDPGLPYASGAPLEAPCTPPISTLSGQVATDLGLVVGGMYELDQLVKSAPTRTS